MHDLRCATTSGTRLVLPHDFVATTAGNNGGPIMLNSTHVVQMQSLYHCAAGLPGQARGGAVSLLGI